MPRIDSASCEPFRAWNRLEPRTRDKEFDKELECGVHDALWMLTRQWQMGELQGEDTGSAIFAKIQLRTTRINNIKTAKGPVEVYNEAEPLEKRIEQISTAFDAATSMQLAYLFLQALERAATTASPAIADFNRGAYKAQLRTLFPLPDVPVITTADSKETILTKAETAANEKLATTLQSASTRYFDGMAVLKSLGNAALSTQIAITPAHVTMVTTALTNFGSAATTIVGTAVAGQDAWMPEQLEYQFACSLPEADSTNTILNAKEYADGNLEWYSVDIDTTADAAALFQIPTADDLSLVKEELITAIPVEAKFGGAPNSRWWQFENGNIDLGNISAEKTDIAKMITTEYALLYGNDWLIVPYVVPAGTLCEITGIVVKDVFGERQFIEAAVQGQSDNWAGWGMFNLSTLRTDAARDQPVDTRLFIPPAAIKTLESEAVEEVHFVRDEMTNNVWAVETKIPDGVGGWEDGHAFARSYRNLLAQFEAAPPAATDVAAMFQYVLGNTVPENWIPFIPVHTDDTNRAIKLQRASMPRLFQNDYTRVRPRTQLVRFGINDTQQQTAPYFVHEEEVPRAGVHLTGSHQRTRWYNGAIMNWYGYRKKWGRGEGSSGLRYDSLTPVKK